MLLPALCGVPWQGPTASKHTLRLLERRKAQETTTSDVEVYENKALLASPIGISGCSRQCWNTSLRSANAERSEKVSSREAALGGALHSATTSPPGTLASDSQDLRISTSAKAEAGPRLGALRRGAASLLLPLPRPSVALRAVYFFMLPIPSSLPPPFKFKFKFNSYSFGAELSTKHSRHSDLGPQNCFNFLQNQKKDF